ncbi:MAG: Mth938-like domain-containing protein [Burkholderiales bacterium]|nr:Mth938-like domain-containing protein [Burkholderiales bacterium]
MKLHQDNPSTFNRFTGYGAGYVMIDRTRIEHSLIVLPGEPAGAWRVSGFEALCENDFEPLVNASPEIVLLGTGQTQRFPHPKLFRNLYDARIGIEVMDCAAACRTYNILMDEGRRVAAALILGS